jgi:hypothetical protein
MAEPVPSSGSRAVFLSYTSEDKAVALALCEALREGGVEVWMDQSELQGGDAWDEHIRRQLRECALIIPIISARTQARHEGYFRLEWKLADERSHLVAEGKPLLVPVVADDTQQKEALVPKSFLTVQWTRLPHGHVPPAFVVRVRRLLGLESGSASLTQAPMTMVAGATLETIEPTVSASSRSGSRLVPFLLTAVLALTAGALASWKLKPAPPAPARVVSRWVYELPPDQEMRANINTRLGVSHDGRAFVYSTSKGLYLRQLGELESRLIPGTETGSQVNPFFSPDGQSLGFLYPASNGGLKRIPIRGGPSTDIVPTGRGGAVVWNDDGTVLYGGRGGYAGIRRVPASGGVPELLVKAEATENTTSPQLLPGGDLVLFTLSTTSTDGTTGPEAAVVQSLKTGTRTVLVRGASATRYLPTGHLVYIVDRTLFGVRFDRTIPAVSGAPVPLVSGILRGVDSRSTTGSYQIAISDDGTLVYQVERADSVQRRLVWVDRQGTETPLSTALLDTAAEIRLSPEETRFALLVAGDLWVHYLDGKPPIKLVTAVTGNISSLRWTPDGHSMAYAVGSTGIFQIRADGSETSARRISPVGAYYARDWSADGKYMLAYTSSAGGDIVQWPVDDYSKVEPVVQTAAVEGSTNAVLSPDGRWLAYDSNQTGRGEIWVRPYPGPGAAQRVSTNGGVSPRWERQSRELYFVEGTGATQRMMAAKVQAGATFNFELAQPLFNTNDYVSYNVAADGRFLFVRNANPGTSTPPARIVVVENWFEEVKRLLPGK